MKRYKLTIDGRSFEVEVLGDPMGDRVEVNVDGEVLAVEVRREADAAVAAVSETRAEPRRPVPAAGRPVTAPAAVPMSPASNSVRAPLPGVVKRVAVKTGQEIAPGELLLVIEAMKMDNAIRATRGGVIQAVQAVEGRQVAHGDELVSYRA